MEYYSIVAKNEIMRFTGKYMELQNIILNDLTQTQKDKCFMFFITSESLI